MDGAQWPLNAGGSVTLTNTRTVCCTPRVLYPKGGDWFSAEPIRSLVAGLVAV